jgi:hypothetical protein
MASINIFFHKYNSKFTKLSKAFSFILYFVLTSEFLKLLYPLRLLKLQKKSWYHERCPSSVTVCGPLQGIWPFVKSSLVACWKVFDCASNARWWLVARYFNMLQVVVGRHIIMFQMFGGCSFHGIWPCFECSLQGI